MSVLCWLYTYKLNIQIFQNPPLSSQVCSLLELNETQTPESRRCQHRACLLSFSHMDNAYISVSKAFKEGPMTLYLPSKSQISILKSKTSCRMSVFLPLLLSKHTKNQKLLVVYLMSLFCSNITFKNHASTAMSPIALERRHR